MLAASARQRRTGRVRRRLWLTGRPGLDLQPRHAGDFLLGRHVELERGLDALFDFGAVGRRAQIFLDARVFQGRRIRFNDRAEFQVGELGVLLGALQRVLVVDQGGGGSALAGSLSNWAGSRESMKLAMVLLF